MSVSAARTAADGSSRLAEAAFHDGSVIGFKDCQAGTKQLALRDNYDIVSRRQVIASENLSYQTFSTISLDGAAKFSRGGNPQTSHGQVVASKEDGAVPAVHARPKLVDLLKLWAATDPVGSSKLQTLFAADGEPLAALRATPLEDQTAIFGAHPHQESVRPSAVPRVGLKCSLALHASPSWWPLRTRVRRCQMSCRRSFLVNELSIIAKGFRQCQSPRLCVTVGVLRQDSRRSFPAFGTMRVRSLTRVFHTCGKNCGKSRQISSRSTVDPRMSRFLTRNDAEWRVNSRISQEK
jgi:hypothetical protein